MVSLGIAIGGYTRIPLGAYCPMAYWCLLFLLFFLLCYFIALWLTCPGVPLGFLWLLSLYVIVTSYLHIPLMFFIHLTLVSSTSLVPVAFCSHMSNHGITCIISQDYFILCSHMCYLGNMSIFTHHNQPTLDTGDRS